MNTANETLASKNSLARLLKDTQAKDLLLKSVAAGKELRVIGYADSTKFYWVSQAFSEVLGLEFEDVVEVDFFKFVHPDDMERSLRASEYFLMHKKPGYEVLFPNRWVGADDKIVKFGWEELIYIDHGTDMYAMKCKILTDKRYEEAVENLKTFWDGR